MRKQDKVHAQAKKSHRANDVETFETNITKAIDHSYYIINIVGASLNDTAKTCTLTSILVVINTSVAHSGWLLCSAMQYLY